MYRYVMNDKCFVNFNRPTFTFTSMIETLWNHLTQIQLDRLDLGSYVFPNF